MTTLNNGKTGVSILMLDLKLRLVLGGLTSMEVFIGRRVALIMCIPAPNISEVKNS